MRTNHIFRDRTEAGQALARLLEPYRADAPFVLGLPRGGVVVAYEVAKALGAPLDVIVARKLGVPFQPELAMGAVAPNGVVLIDRRFGLSDSEIAALIDKGRAEMEQRLQRYRGRHEGPHVRGRTVILVDDGLATGLTAQAAVRALRREQPRRIIVAVPVASTEALRVLEQEADTVIAVTVPRTFRAIGLWYDDFTPVSNEQVVSILSQARQGSSVERRPTSNTGSVPQPRSRAR